MKLYMYHILYVKNESIQYGMVSSFFCHFLYKRRDWLEKVDFIFSAVLFEKFLLKVSTFRGNISAKNRLRGIR